MSDEQSSGKPPTDAEIEAILSELTSDDAELSAPPPDLWQHIEAEVSSLPAPGSEGAVEGELETSEPPVVAPVVELRRRNPSRFLTFAAAAAVVVLAIVGFSVGRLLSSDDTVSRAELAYDADAFDPLGANASASVSVVDKDGRLVLHIDESELPNTDEGALEVWLIEPDADGNPVDLVSLGTIDPTDPTDLSIPQTHDPEVFFVVDISIEPNDGDPTHSGRSILRGPLAST